MYIYIYIYIDIFVCVNVYIYVKYIDISYIQRLIDAQIYLQLYVYVSHTTIYQPQEILASVYCISFCSEVHVFGGIWSSMAVVMHFRLNSVNATDFNVKYSIDSNSNIVQILYKQNKVNMYCAELARVLCCSRLPQGGKQTLVLNFLKVRH